MANSQEFKFGPESAEAVIADAKKRQKEGKDPVMLYLTETDPEQALELALAVKKKASLTKMSIMFAFANQQSISWCDLNDNGLRLAVQRICYTSETELEIRERVKEELGYLDDLTITLLSPRTKEERDLREYVRGMGGVTTVNGDIVNGVINSRDGEIIAF